MSINRRAIAYLATELNNIQTLKLSCERDEAQLNSVLVALIIGKIENNASDKPATVAVYERVSVPPPPNTKIGELFLVAVGPGVNPTAVIAQQNALGNRHLFDGAAHIGNNSGVIMVFKPKQ